MRIDGFAKILAGRHGSVHSRTHAGLKGETRIQDAGIQRRKSQILSMAATLSRALSNFDCGVSMNSPWTRHKNLWSYAKKVGFSSRNVKATIAVASHNYFETFKQTRDHANAQRKAMAV